MSDRLPFQPDNGVFGTSPTSSTSTISASQTASGALQVRKSSDVARTAIITSEPGGSTAFVRFGDSNVVATTADFPILAGTAQPFTITGETHISAICASGKTATVYVSMGRGE